MKVMATENKMDESRFEALADETLERFMDVIDEVLGDTMDVDLESGILKIELESGGQYVVNKHAPNRQIWLSSPVSGAAHFGYDEETSRWVSTRGEGVLTEILAKELEMAGGVPVDL